MNHFLTTLILYLKMRNALRKTAILSKWYFCVLGVDYYVSLRILNGVYNQKLFSISLYPNSKSGYWDVFGFWNLHEMLGYKFAK